MSSSGHGEASVEESGRPATYLASDTHVSGPGRERESRGAWYWISAWVPVLIGIGVIVIESTPWLGANYTSGPLRKIFEAIFGPVGDARWNLIHFCIRKTGHFTAYGLIALAWLRAWRMSIPRVRFLAAAALALLGTALLATWDEWHQSLLPNRTGSPWDVLLDCCGALVFLLGAYLFLRLFGRSGCRGG